MASTAGNRMKAIFEADISDFKKKVEQAEQLMADYVKKMEDSGRALKESKRHTEKLKKQQAKLNNELKRGTTSQDKFNSKNEELNQQIKKSEQLTESLQKEFEELRGDVRSASNAMEEMGHNSKQYAQQSKKTATATSRMDKGLTRFNHTTGSANNVMMSFGQTIQDAPYGIRGVANNITFLAESFGDMVNQTGSAKNAFKALGSTLTGPTGIILAISTITSALVVYGDEIINAIKGTSGLAKATKSFLGDARMEAATLTSLINIAKNENESKEVRLQAIDKLNEKYDEYLPKLDLENIKTRKVAKAVALLTDKLVQQAKIRGIKDYFSDDFEEAAGNVTETAEQLENYEDRLKEIAKNANIEFKADVSLVDQPKVWKQLIELQNKEVENAPRSRKTGAVIGGLPVSNALRRYNTALESHSDALEEINDLEQRYKDILSAMQLGLLKTTSKQKKHTESLEETKKAREKITAIEAPQGETTKLKLDTSLEPVQFNWENIITDEAFDNFMAKLTQAKNLAQVMSNAISSSFSVMASKLSESLGISNDILNAFVSSILQSLAKVASQALSGFITQKLINGVKIQAKKQLAIASAITSAANAAALIPGGFFALPGMIGAATAQVQSAFSGLQAFAGGGIVSGGSFTGDNVPIMVNSGEMILNNRQQSKLFSMLNGQLSGNNDMPQIKVNVVGRISGENIKLASDRYTRKRNRIG